MNIINFLSFKIMELKEYLVIIKKEYKIIILIAFLVAISTFLFSINKKTTYETSLALFVDKNTTQQTDDFKYDGYYALQTSEILVDNISAWIKSPTIVALIYQESKIDQNFENIKSYTKKFTTKKMSSQYIEINFQTDSEEDAKKLSTTIINMTKNKVKSLEKDSLEELAFSINNENPVIIKNKSELFLNSFFGFVSGIFLGIFIVFLRRYLK